MEEFGRTLSSTFSFMCIIAGGAAAARRGCLNSVFRMSLNNRKSRYKARGNWVCRINVRFYRAEAIGF